LSAFAERQFACGRQCARAANARAVAQVAVLLAAILVTLLVNRLGAIRAARQQLTSDSGSCAVVPDEADAPAQPTARAAPAPAASAPPPPRPPPPPPPPPPPSSSSPQPVVRTVVRDAADVKDADGWSACSAPCGTGIQARVPALQPGAFAACPYVAS
jgi:hypothetical protein